jgi:hypothetical protein
LDSNTDDDARLNRGEFIGAMIRCANMKYKDTGKEETIAASFEKLLTEDILNRSSVAQGVYFRQKHLKQDVVDKLAQNEENL